MENPAKYECPESKLISQVEVYYVTNCSICAVEMYGNVLYWEMLGARQGVSKSLVSFDRNIFRLIPGVPALMFQQKLRMLK
jgi:hypothetical protein